MFSQPVTITYTDGTTEEVTLDQWSIGEFANWAQSKGLHFDAASPGIMAVTMLRYQAYCQKHRGQTKALPSYAAWNMTVASVDNSEAVPVDPTPAAT